MKKLFVSIMMLVAVSTFAQEKSEFPIKGYRGSCFVYYVSNADDWESYSFGTTHGYQINPNWFVGGGLQLNLGSLLYESDDYSFVSATGYANVRFDMLHKPISPYLNFKIGLTDGDITGAYIAPEVGVRFRHFNLGVGAELQSHEAVYGLAINESGSEFSELLMIRLAYDFGGRRK